MGFLRILLMRCGRQYVMIRSSNRFSFYIRHAYPIAGRWYVSTYRGGGHLLLTNDNRVTKFERLDPMNVDSSLVSELWMPITERCDAGVRMID